MATASGRLEVRHVENPKDATEDNALFSVDLSTAMPDAQQPPA